MLLQSDVGEERLSEADPSSCPIEGRRQLKSFESRHRWHISGTQTYVYDVQQIALGTLERVAKLFDIICQQRCSSRSGYCEEPVIGVNRGEW